MRPDFAAVEQVDRDVGGFVADHFAKQFGVLGFEKRGVDVDSARGRLAAAEGTAEAGAGFDSDSFPEVARTPGDGPFREPGVDIRCVHRSSSLPVSTAQ